MRKHGTLLTAILAFALFYNPSDWTAIGAAAADKTIPSDLKARALNYWNGGLKNYASAGTCPVGHERFESDCKYLVISYGNRADFVDLLKQIGTRVPKYRYMIAIADDIATGAGSSEPWPGGPPPK